MHAPTCASTSAAHAPFVHNARCVCGGGLAKCTATASTSFGSLLNASPWAKLKHVQGQGLARVLFRYIASALKTRQRQGRTWAWPLCPAAHPSGSALWRCTLESRTSPRRPWTEPVAPPAGLHAQAHDHTEHQHQHQHRLADVVIPSAAFFPGAMAGHPGRQQVNKRWVSRLQARGAHVAQPLQHRGPGTVGQARPTLIRQSTRTSSCVGVFVVGLWSRWVAHLLALPERQPICGACASVVDASVQRRRWRRRGARRRRGWKGWRGRWRRRR